MGNVVECFLNILLIVESFIVDLKFLNICRLMLVEFFGKFLNEECVEICIDLF